MEPDEVFVVFGAVGDSAPGDHGRDLERRFDRGEDAVKAVRILIVVLGHRDYPLISVE